MDSLQLDKNTVNIKLVDVQIDEIDKSNDSIVQKYYDNQDSLQEFIEILSEKASVNPAIDIYYEDHQKPIEVITEQQLIQWRKDQFWRKNIENIINLLFAQAHDIYHIQKNKYDEDLKYYNTLSEEEKKDYDKEEDYGLR